MLIQLLYKKIHSTALLCTSSATQHCIYCCHDSRQFGDLVIWRYVHITTASFLSSLSFQNIHFKWHDLCPGSSSSRTVSAGKTPRWSGAKDLLVPIGAGLVPCGMCMQALQWAGQWPHSLVRVVDVGNMFPICTHFKYVTKQTWHFTVNVFILSTTVLTVMQHKLHPFPPILKVLHV